MLRIVGWNSYGLVDDRKLSGVLGFRHLDAPLNVAHGVEILLDFALVLRTDHSCYGQTSTTSWSCATTSRSRSDAMHSSLGAGTSLCPSSAASSVHRARAILRSSTIRRSFYTTRTGSIRRASSHPVSSGKSRSSASP